MEELDLLILGAGWTSLFLIPLLKDKGYTFAATTTTGHDDTIAFRFEPDSANWRDAFDVLPTARHVLVTFPVLGAEAAGKLVEGYRGRRRAGRGSDARLTPLANDGNGKGKVEARGPRGGTERWILLGSTGIWQAGGTRTGAPPRSVTTTSSSSGPHTSDAASSSAGSSSTGDDRHASTIRAPLTSITACAARTITASATPSVWLTRHSPIDPTSVRGKGEAYFLDGRHVSPARTDGGHEAVGPSEDVVTAIDATVLNLAGLWGGRRDPRTWVDRVAGDPESVAAKTSLHLIHGVDVATAIVGVVAAWDAHGSAPATSTGDMGRQGGVGTETGELCRAGTITGQRWMLTDEFVYDWWSLMVAWAPEKQGIWARQAMRHAGVRALPRAPETLGRAYDAREFWETIGEWPRRSAWVAGDEGR